MKTSRTLLAFLLVAAAGVAVPPARAASGSDPLALVPAGAASVAVIHLDQLRTSPLSARLFGDADKLTADGDAARFMMEADLSPKKDVDTVVVAGMPSNGGDTPVIAIFQGRFDPDRLAAAAESRGATRKSSPGGDYELLPEKGSKAPAAAAFVSRDLVIVGTESVVVDVLAARRGGLVGLTSGAGLGRHLGRVDRGAAAWALVDVHRYPSLQRKGATHPESEGKSEPAAALASAMKSVSLFAVEATPRGDGLEFAATGLSADADTRQLLEDSLRGLLAMWRLSVEDKQPELVSALRKFRVGNDGEGVTIRGTLPASVIRSIGQKKKTEN